MELRSQMIARPGGRRRMTTSANPYGRCLDSPTAGTDTAEGPGHDPSVPRNSQQLALGKIDGDAGRLEPLGERRLHGAGGGDSSIFN